MRVTKVLIEEYLDLEERAKALRREASDLAKQQQRLGETLLEFVRAHGGPTRTVPRCGFVLAIHTARGAVSWKEHFVRLAGVAAAEELIAAAPEKEILSVQPG